MFLVVSFHVCVMCLWMELINKKNTDNNVTKIKCFVKCFARASKFRHTPTTINKNIQINTEQTLKSSEGNLHNLNYVYQNRVCESLVKAKTL